MAIDIFLFLLASPILLLKWLVQSIRRCVFWKVAYSTRIMCQNCGEYISLLGQWKCDCGHEYQGHLLRRCPFCQTTPQNRALFRVRNNESVAKAMRLTYRCIKILSLVNVARWLSMGQLHLRFFRVASVDATRKRIRKLVAARYLRKVA